MKKTLATLLTAGTLLASAVKSAVIDVPIGYTQQNNIQFYYDQAQDGDTLRFKKVEQPDLHANLIADEEKNITIDMNGYRWDGNVQVTSFSGKGLTIKNGMLNQHSISAYGQSNLNIEDVRFNRFSEAINWQSSGNLTLENWTAQSYNMGSGTLVNVSELIGDSKINISRGVLYQAEQFVRLGTDTYANNPILSVTHNTVNETTKPLIFTSELTRVTGDIANNAFSELETLVTNPLYARRLRIISNNIVQYDKVSDEGVINDPFFAMSLAMNSESSDPLIDNNYFFESGFEGQDWYNFNLTSNSPLIDRGIDLGQSYKGLAPDIGRFESIYGGVPEPSTGLLIGLSAGALAMKRQRKGSGGKR